MAIRPHSGRNHRTDLAIPAEGALSALLGMPGRLVTLTFRGTRVRVLVDHDRAAQQPARRHRGR
jgi:hypothetical protein